MKIINLHIIPFLKNLLAALLLSLSFSCVERIDFETQEFEDFLVVEVLITNENKRHQVKLSRTYGVDLSIYGSNNSPEGNQEENARVYINTSNGEIYDFSETSSGLYESQEEFAAQPGRTYQLNIETSSGEIYQSEAEELLPGGEINDIMVERRYIENTEGLAITVNSGMSEDASSYYKFEYEEAYKVVSPFKYPIDLFFDFTTETFYEVWKDYEEEVCYATDSSSDIILASTQNLASNRLDNFLVEFIEIGNPKVSHRYSILIKQIAISERAYNYFKTQEELSSNNNLFSQVQPGFVYGNIQPVNTQKEVIGYFNVSEVSGKRIFFNFLDYHSIFDLRTFVATGCEVDRPILVPFPYGTYGSGLFEQLNAGEIKYFGPTEDNPRETPYQFVPGECINCRFWGDLEPPEYWVE